jgi:hypothetical protein
VDLFFLLETAYIAEVERSCSAQKSMVPMKRMLLFVCLCVLVENVQVLLDLTFWTITLLFFQNGAEPLR